MLHCPSAAVSSTVLLGLRAAPERQVGQTTPPHPLQLAVARTAPARRRTLPAVSKLTAHINYALRRPPRPWTLIQYLCPFPAEQVDGATVSSQPADSTSAASDTETKENAEDGEMAVAVGEEDGEPNAAELRRRRLRKLETPSPSTSPPPDN